jgi:hypothetical protein
VKKLQGYKTYILAALAIITAWVTFAVGDFTMAQAVEATFAAIAAMTIRSGINTAAKAAILLLPCLLLLGCATTDQQQPTTQKSEQKDEQWADSRINVNVTNNFGTSAPDSEVDDVGGTVKASKTAAGNVPKGTTVTIGDTSVSVTVGSTTSESDKGTGATQANSTATATPTNDVKPTTNLTIPAIP